MEAKGQLSLFSSKATARKDDPATSKKAAEIMNNKGAVQIHEVEILKALKQHPGSTAKELGLIMASKKFNIDITTCRGIVEEAGKPHRRISGMGDKVRMEERKKANIYYALDKDRF